MFVMPTTSACSPHPSRFSALRVVVLGGLLAVPIIVGLLSMHILAMHGSPAALWAQSSPHSISEHSSADAGNVHHSAHSDEQLDGHVSADRAHASAAGHSTAYADQSSATDHSSAQAEPTEHTSASEHLPACPGCQPHDGHVGMMLGCVLALLAVALVLALPRVRPQWFHAEHRIAARQPLPERHARRPRAPSLTVLCISRT